MSRLWSRLLVAALLSAVGLWLVSLGTDRAGRRSLAARSLAPGEAPDTSPELPREFQPARAVLFYVLGLDQPAPAGVAPLLRLEAGGRLVLERGGPIPAGPTEPTPGASIASGLRLPGDSIDALSPAERAGLLACWAAFQGPERTVPEPVALGVVDGVRLRSLRRWVR